MKQLFFLLVLFAFSFTVSAQEAEDKRAKVYRESAPLINDLVHTKLDVKFDYSKSYLLGKAWITLKPYFYPTDSLTLDAKGMDIKNVSLVKGN